MQHPFAHARVAGALALIATAACARATQPSPSGTAQPAATNQATVSPAAQAKADSGRPPYTAADVHFMSGMIAHHAQAVVMAGWAPTHGASAAVRALCERIVVAQQDEIAFMQRWLGERHEPVPDAGAPSHSHPLSGMDHAMLMPGMLTAAQLAQLDSARGAEFDRLFLAFMIQHHRGAITMVEQLFSAQGAVRDDMLFKFAADVNADQTTEIDRMSRMLETLTRSPM